MYLLRCWFHRLHICLRRDQARTDGIHSNTKLLARPGKGRRQRINAGLGAIVGQHHRTRTVDASRSTKIENLAVPLALHDGPDGTGTQESRAQVIVQFRLPLAQLLFIRGAIHREPPCQVDEDVDPSIGGQGTLNEGVCPLFRGQISRNGDDPVPCRPQCLGSCVDPRSRAGADRKQGTLARKSTCERIADLTSMADASDESNLTFQAHEIFLSSLYATSEHGSSSVSILTDPLHRRARIRPAATNCAHTHRATPSCASRASFRG